MFSSPAEGATDGIDARSLISAEPHAEIPIKLSETSAVINALRVSRERAEYAEYVEHIARVERIGGGKSLVARYIGAPSRNQRGTKDKSRNLKRDQA